jgi:hypothetical protein
MLHPHTPQKRKANHVPIVSANVEAVKVHNLLERYINTSIMPSSGMCRRVNLVRTDVSEERIPSIFKVEKSTSEEPA